MKEAELVVNDEFDNDAIIGQLFKQRTAAEQKVNQLLGVLHGLKTGVLSLEQLETTPQSCVVRTGPTAEGE